METLPASAPKVDGKAYLGDLRKLVTRLEDDLRVRARELDDVHADFTARYNEAVRSERTLETFESWRDQYLTQVAVGWILSCVFLRYLEDNDLIEEIWLAGEGERLQRAHDRHQLFFRTGPTLTDRDYLLEAFGQVAKLPGCGDLFSSEKNPLWLLGPSGDMAKEILLFFKLWIPPVGSCCAPSETRLQVGWPRRASWGTCIRTCPRRRASGMPCCRPRTSWKSSS
jgi:hypothetical protein